jgi:hypothetical protein
MAVQTPNRRGLFPAATTPRAQVRTLHDVTILVLAHQGGWDEALVVAVPIGLFAWVLRLANRKAARLQAEREADGGTPSTEPES